MKAIVYRRNGPPDVLSCEEIEKPTPNAREVLIKVCGSFQSSGLSFVKRRTRRDAIVTGAGQAQAARSRRCRSGRNCRVGRHRVHSGRRGVRRLPRRLRGVRDRAGVRAGVETRDGLFENAAASPIAALTALQGLRDKGKIQAGQHVLINGASGGVGTFGVQLAKIFGAHVTGVCSARNAELVRSLGAEHTINYAKEDFANGKQRYDLIFDLAGNHSFSACRRVLTPRGIVVGTGILDGPQSLLVLFLALIWMIIRAWFSREKFVAFVANANRGDLALIGELLASGQLKSIIERR
jgi:NADPH:quinone reductase-like Zn-dependent oxidoreductase